MVNIKNKARSADAKRRKYEKRHAKNAKEETTKMKSNELEGQHTTDQVNQQKAHEQMQTDVDVEKKTNDRKEKRKTTQKRTNNNINDFVSVSHFEKCTRERWI